MLSPHAREIGSSDGDERYAETDEDSDCTPGSEFSDVQEIGDLDYRTSDESESDEADQSETVSNGFAAFQDSVLNSGTLRPIDLLVLPNNPTSLRELGFQVIDPCAAGALRHLQTPSRPERPGNLTPFNMDGADGRIMNLAPANPRMESGPSAAHHGSSVNKFSNPPKLQTSTQPAKSVAGSTSSKKVAEPPKNNGSTSAPKKDAAADQSKVVCNLRALLISSPCAISSTELNGDYKAMVGGDIPFKNFGFQSLESFLQSLDDVFKVEIVNKKMFVKAKLAEDSQHLSSMVTKQKKTSKKTKKRIKAAAGVTAKKTQSKLKPGNSSWLYNNSGRGNWVPPPRMQRQQASRGNETLWRQGSVGEQSAPPKQEQPVNLGQTLVYSGPTPLYSGQMPVYSVPAPFYPGPMPVYPGQMPVYSADTPVFSGETPIYSAEKPKNEGETPKKCGNPMCVSVEECATANRKFLSCLPLIGNQFTEDLKELPAKQLSYAASLITDILDAARRNSLCPATSISGLISRQPGGKIIFKPGPKASANSHLAEFHKRKCCCGCPSDAVNANS